ncbi:MAG TPA: heparan-alpha-glucosaminide N-acetyltransferase [Bauldia sp.]|nr:heparan-alpha-glucosaminide N-acetyltransferase [Bauldia sp.]
MAAIPDADPPRRPARIAVVDLARGMAIVAMVVYHTAFDLAGNGLIATDVATDIHWKVFARTIAGTFLALVGIGLVLASRNGLNWRAYLRRLAFIAGGAALVSIATFWFDRTTFVFFGILHEIALASVLALPFLWAPVWLTALAAAALIVAPLGSPLALSFAWGPIAFTLAPLASPVFDQPWLWWVGLSTVTPVTIDYVPVFPWFGVVLAGVVLGRMGLPYAERLAAVQPRDVVSRLLMLAGRWSLAIYLVHQPLIVGALYVFTLLNPPSEAFLRERWVGQCTPACVGDRTEQACTTLCGCLFNGLYGTDLYSMRATTDMTPEQQTRWDALVDRCRAAAP